MKKTFFSAIIFLAACQTTKNMTVSKALTPLEKAQVVYPSTTIAELSDGKAMYAKQCTVCHGFEAPSKYSISKWDHILPEMVEKANKYKNAKLTDEDFILLRKYVISELN